MKSFFVAISLVLLLCGVVRAQVVDERQLQADEVRAIVKSFGSKPTKVSLVTRSLVFRTGKVVAARENSFHLRYKSEPSDKTRIIDIPYQDVLELDAGGKWVSFVPEVTARNHGSMKDVGKIFAGTRILVIYTDKKADLKYEIGFANSVSKTHLVMIDKNGRARIDMPIEQVRAVYGLVDGRAGVKSSLSKNSTTGTDAVVALLQGIAAGVGALFGMVKDDDEPIMVFSR